MKWAIFLLSLALALLAVNFVLTTCCAPPALVLERRFDVGEGRYWLRTDSGWVEVDANAFRIADIGKPLPE